MATPKRTLILADLVSTLQAITVAGGFLTTVARVERAPKTWQQVTGSQRPWISVVAGQERPREQPGQYRIEFDVDLHCLVQASAEASKILAINNLRHDIRRAINLDQTRGANPDVVGDRNATMTNIRLYEIEDVEDATEGYLGVGLTVVYMEGAQG